jgi:hypothetical protein
MTPVPVKREMRRQKDDVEYDEFYLESKPSMCAEADRLHEPL